MPDKVLRVACIGHAPIVWRSAGMRDGCRWISGGVDTPGRVGACQFGRLNIEAKEDRPMGDEPRVWAQRRRADGGPFDAALTDKAHAMLRSQVSAGLARGVFSDVWHALYAQSPYLTARDPASEAAELRVRAGWWDTLDAVLDIVRADPAAVEYQPLERDHNHLWPQQLLVPDGDRSRWAQLTSRVVCHGEHVGWLDTGGQLLPLVGLPR